MTTHTTHSEAETRELGRAIAEEHGRAGVCIAFSGELGTGKTALIRGICAYFGCEDQVTSPTFTIVNEYRAASLDIVHADLYRLNAVQDMLDIGLDELFLEPRLHLIEWAERALPILPVPRIEIASFHGNSDTARIYRVQFFESGMKSILHVPDTFI